MCTLLCHAILEPKPNYQNHVEGRRCPYQKRWREKCQQDTFPRTTFPPTPTQAHTGQKVVEEGGGDKLQKVVPLSRFFGLYLSLLLSKRPIFNPSRRLLAWLCKETGYLKSLRVEHASFKSTMGTASLKGTKGTIPSTRQSTSRPR